MESNHQHNVMLPYLSAGEHLVWSDRPGKGVVFYPGDAYRIFLSIFWTVISLLGVVSVVSQGESIAIVIFFILMVGFGCHLAFGRFIYQARLRSRTFYGLTGQRLLIAVSFTHPRCTSIPLQSLQGMSLSCDKSGMGTITLDAPHKVPLGDMLAFLPLPPGRIKPRLERIRNAREVFDRIRSAQGALNSRD